MAIFNTVYGGTGYKTFTITWEEKSDMSSWWTYSDNADWLTAGSSAFDDFFWYSWVRLSASGVETAIQAQNAWILDITQLWNLTSGDNVMIKFPRRWIKMSKSWNFVTLSITDNPDAPWFQYYAFSRGSLDYDSNYEATGTITETASQKKDAFYLWVYEWYISSNVLKSYSGVSPSASVNQANFINYARANDGNSGDNWYDIEWWFQSMYIAALYMMKYWNPKSEAIIWPWAVSWKQNTGWTNSQTSATYWTSSAWSMKLFGLENWYANMSELVWWVNLDNSNCIWATLSWFIWSQVTSQTGWYAKLWTYATWYWLNISKIVWDNLRMFYPSEQVSNSNYNTYYCATSFCNKNLMRRWCNFWDWSNKWWWLLSQDYNVWSNTSANWLGTRLMYL